MDFEEVVGSGFTVLVFIILGCIAWRVIPSDSQKFDKLEKRVEKLESEYKWRG